MTLRIPSFFSIFVSFAHEDMAWCKRFVAELRRHLADVWYDEFDVKYTSLSKQIEHEIACRPVFVCLVSWASHSSEWVRREYTAAVGLTERQPERMLIPVLIEDCGLPFMLGDQVYESGLGVTPEETARRVAAKLTAGVMLPNASAVRDLRERASQAKAQGRPDTALAYYKRALEAARQSRNCAGTIIDTCADWQRYGAQEFDNRYRRLMYDKDSPIEWNELGDEWRRRREWHDALVAYFQALSRDDRSARGWTGAGEALSALGEYADALSAFGCALDVNPNSSRAWKGRGDVLGCLYQLDKAPQHAEVAMQAYDRALAIVLDPAQPQPQGMFSPAHAMGAVSGMLDRTRELIHNIAQRRHLVAVGAVGSAASERSVQWAQWQETIERVEVLTTLGRYHEALSQIDAAILLRSHSAVAWFKRGVVLRKLNRFSDAEQAFDRVLGLDARFVDAWTLRGHALFHLRRFPEALGCLQRALDLIPSDPVALHLAGSVLRELNRLDEALEQFEKVLRTNPDAPTVLVSKSKTLERMDRAAEAIAACEEALKYDPTSREALAHLKALTREVQHPTG